MEKKAQTDRRLAAVVVADVVGYSRMMGDDELGTLEAFAACRHSVIEPLIGSHGGRTVKLLGDGLLIEFPSAVNAVRCAVLIQSQMEATNDHRPSDRKIVLRIGINLGDIIGQDDDIYGDGVNIATRLEPLAPAGGICISGKVFDEIDGKIDEGARLIGDVELKNIKSPIRAYVIDRSGPATRDLIAPSAKTSTRGFTTLAVLPFSNLSRSPDDDYLVDGLTEDLITELSRHRNLSLVARSTAAQLKDTKFDAVEAGRSFGADFVVTGGIRVNGGRIRTSFQVTDTETRREVVSERVDHSMDDAFAVQDEIVDAIVGHLYFDLPSAAQAAIARRSTDRPSAYLQWLRANSTWRNGDEQSARQHMQEAVEADPRHGPALASLSLMYSYWRFSEPSRQTDAERKERALEYAARALAAIKNDPFVLATVAVSHLLVGSIPDALRHSDIAMSLSPRDINVQVTRGMILSYAGKHHEGLQLVQKACRFEPVLPPTFISSLGDCSFLARDFEGALAAYRSLVDPPSFFKANEAACLVHLGQPEEACRTLQGLPPTFDIALYAENTASMCASSEDAQVWRSGLRGGQPLA